ncbi:hypothetical protein ANN_23637 [Periplaneta americana]|uniref:GIY-YIG domain-containing protein n=1 Tax=Periplaneta americana TaxID=6978 RepID=A0ABQ8SM36_PERAM|nr:hypothetical protein ANN_23637 [Periplaneta americana]
MTTCKSPKIMFTKLEQRSSIKIDVARGRSAQECFQGLREAPPPSSSAQEETMTLGEQSMRNINKHGRADGVRRLPNIWQKVINKRGDYIEAVSIAKLSSVGEINDSDNLFDEMHTIIWKRKNPKQFIEHKSNNGINNGGGAGGGGGGGGGVVVVDGRVDGGGNDGADNRTRNLGHRRQAVYRLRYPDRVVPKMTVVKVGCSPSPTRLGQHNTKRPCVLNFKRFCAQNRSLHNRISYYIISDTGVAQTLARLTADPELRSGVGSIPAWADYLVGFFRGFLQTKNFGKKPNLAISSSGNRAAPERNSRWRSKRLSRLSYFGGWFGVWRSVDGMISGPTKPQWVSRTKQFPCGESVVGEFAGSPPIPSLACGWARDTVLLMRPGRRRLHLHVGRGLSQNLTRSL